MGPYSTSMRAGPMLYLSGQGAIDPATGEATPGDIEAETRQTLANVERLLRTEGFSFTDLVQVTCYLTDLREWPRMNEAYADVLGEDARPTRTAVGVAELPFGLRIEMTCVAYRADAPGRLSG